MWKYIHIIFGIPQAHMNSQKYTNGLCILGIMADAESGVSR